MVCVQGLVWVLQRSESPWVLACVAFICTLEPCFLCPQFRMLLELGFAETKREIFLNGCLKLPLEFK